MAEEMIDSCVLADLAALLVAWQPEVDEIRSERKGEEKLILA